MSDAALKAVARAVCACVAVGVITFAVLSTGGCGGNSPEAAVRQFFDSWQSNDWEAHVKSVAPGRKLTKDQEALAKNKFEQIKIEFKDLEMQSKIDGKDKNRATVTVTGGQIVYTVNILGNNKTETQDISRMDADEKPSFDVVNVNGTWFVDTPLG